MRTSARMRFARGEELCFLCLKKGHLRVNCKGEHCKQCGLNHHSLLHFEARNPPNQAGVEDSGTFQLTAPSDNSLNVHQSRAAL